jgi:hypothetical protein
VLLLDLWVFGPIPGEVAGMLLEPGAGQRVAATELLPVGVVPTGAALAVALTLAGRMAAGELSFRPAVRDEELPAEPAPSSSNHRALPPPRTNEGARITAKKKRQEGKAPLSANYEQRRYGGGSAERCQGGTFSAMFTNSTP